MVLNSPPLLIPLFALPPPPYPLTSSHGSTFCYSSAILGSTIQGSFMWQIGHAHSAENVSHLFAEPLFFPSPPKPKTVEFLGVGLSLQSFYLKRNVKLFHVYRAFFPASYFLYIRKACATSVYIYVSHQKI